MSLPAPAVEPLQPGDAAHHDLSDARRRAGHSLLAWLKEAEPLLSQADVRQLMGLAAELTGRRLRGAARR